MEIELVERDDNITQVALIGRLDVQGMHEIDIKFHGYTAARKQPAIVDLSRVEFIASLGMGMLISCAQSLGRSDAKMVLLNPQKEVAETLKAAGVDQTIPVVYGLSEAEAKLQAA